MAERAPRHQYDTDAWHLVGGYRRGIGRSWLVWAHREEDDDVAEACTSAAVARRLLRDHVAQQGVPPGTVRYRLSDNGTVVFCYVPARHYL